MIAQPPPGVHRPRPQPWRLILRLPSKARVLTVVGGLDSGPLQIHASELDAEHCDLGWQGSRPSGEVNRAALPPARDDLPFADGSVDCVVLLPGRSAWMSGSHNAGTHAAPEVAETSRPSFPRSGFRARRKAQRRFLAGVRRILKPDGQLVVLADNRYDHGYLRGQRDPCSGLRFTSLLPRWAANVYSILATGKGYCACTHSLVQYRRLLRDAGYTRLETCGLTPNCERPAELIPYEVGQTWRAAKSRGLDRIRRNRRFVPSYGIIASTTTPPWASVAEEIAREIEVMLHANPGSCVFSAFRITRKNKGIISAEVEDRSIIVKVGFDTAAEGGNQRNYHFLERAEHIGELRELVPRPVATNSVSGVRYYAETRVRGTILDHALNTDNSSGYLPGISTALRAINSDLSERQPQPFAGDVYRKQVLSPLDRIEQATGRHSLIEDVRTLFHTHLGNRPIRQGLVHGDFCGSNITVVDFTVTGIIDWEDTYDEGIAALDALNYVEALHRIGNRGAPTVEILSGLDRWGSLASAEQQFLEEHYLRCGVDHTCHFALTYLYWVRHVADQLDGGLENNPQALEERVIRPLEQFVERARS